MEINWEVFTPMEAALGGALIGISASIILLYQGKVAGISGILGGFFRWPVSEIQYRSLFLGGLLLGGIIVALLLPQAYEIQIERSIMRKHTPHRILPPTNREDSMRRKLRDVSQFRESL